MKDKKKSGFPTRFKDEDFLEVLTTTPQTTTQIKKAVSSSRDTAARTLKRLATEGMKVNDGVVYPVEMIEIEAGTGTGKMYLWKITEAGIKTRNEEQENQTMKEFTKFSKEDQRLICEAMLLNNDAALNAMKGNLVDNTAEFEACVKNMSDDAKLYMIELLENSLPKEYK